MLMFRLGSLVMMALWAYCFFDVIRSPEPAIRELPKLLWLLIVAFFPVIGGIAWLLLGRPENASFADPRKGRPHPSTLPPRFAGPAPDDDPDFLRRAEERAHELKRQEMLREWEEEKRRRKLEGGDDTPELGDGA